MATASKAFSGLKRAFQVGRDLEQMQGDISKWMKASSDIDQANKVAKNPPWYKKLASGDSVEQEAIQAFTAQKTLRAQRDELRNLLGFKYGSKAWDDLLKIEAKIRKDRQEQIYAREEFKQKIIEIIMVILFFVVVLGFVGGVIYLYAGK